MTNDNPFQADFTKAKPEGLSSGMQWAIIGALSLLTVVVGGYLSGCAIDRFGAMGAVAIWATGGIAGFVAAKLVSPDRAFGYLLAAAVVVAFLVAETCWIHWHIKGAETLTAAVALLPQFFSDYSTDALVGGVLTFFGASSAYRQAGIRYRYIPVS